MSKGPDLDLTFKCESILLDDNYDIKVANSGLIKQKISEDKNDIFALGVILFILCVGKRPFGKAATPLKID